MLEKEGKVRIPSGCAISGIVDRNGNVFSGEDIIKSISSMRERSNGLGGGFAAYGIYPEYKNYYAFHVFYDDYKAKDEAEQMFKQNFEIRDSGEIPTRNNPAVISQPLIWRYFMMPKSDGTAKYHYDYDEFVVNFVLDINRNLNGAFIVSSGKNMGVFKGVGYPEDLGDFYRLESYSGYIWTAHGRFPTNTPGWWGGAHPFNILDYSVVHNGELSSYGSNRRFLKESGYECTLKTDTEVITYLFDLLKRKHKLPDKYICAVFAPPFWDEIERMPEQEKEIYKNLRIIYARGLLNGPFSIILSTNHGIIALNDRIKLRPLVAAENGSKVYVASEESAITTVCPQPERIWFPVGAEPVICNVSIKEDKLC